MNTLLLAGLILALVEIAKKTFKISSRYIPIVSLGLMSLVMLVFWVLSGYPVIPTETFLTNLVAVLTAMGLYSGVKSTIGK